jgi:hypothetical protein
VSDHSLIPLSLPEAISTLASPYCLEQFSHLTGAALLVVELSDAQNQSSTGPGAEGLAAARTNLEQLPCPTIALLAGNRAGNEEPWAESFDLVLEDDAELSSIAQNILTNPIASLAMVQLLRLNATLSIHQGLIAESQVYSMLQSGPEFGTWLQNRKRPKAAEPNDEPAVGLLRDGSRLHITLNRPERRNAFSAEMRDGLAEALQVTLVDSSIKEVILRGAGPAFCSGGDLAEFGTLPDPATAHAIRSTRNPARLLARCAERVRCEVQGACVGAGVELPAFTANVRAKRDAYFWLPEVSMGLVPGAGGTVSLPRRIGRQRTNYFALSQRRIDAETALRWGLVDELH